VSAIPSATFQEKFHTVDEVCKLLRKSPSWVSREFGNYPGVIRSGKHRLGKRPYVTLLIPEFILQGWIREHTAPNPPGKMPLPSNAVTP
jgi:hypothetical protein